ncbi:protein IQ-DOMAIN 17-like isoform X2 [Salvia splendens]|uniref:protein IQ-DOMAIN 17-like isoform X2 n=1 Tax=Salvia splendens TaxID=180675 RepID=UPI001C270997|nr:protein IQ-DOMAIN 17-like isoform X2 [Salvia splendens]
MGKKGSTSWLTAVKRAFRSPTKDSDADSKSCRRKVEHHRHDDQAKKSERRRWLFRKHSNNNTAEPPVMPPQQRHVIEVAAATAAAAEAEVATAKAAVEMIRMSSNAAVSARVIQTAFRGYLARRALVALKGIVKLQALIRGQNVRKQANMTMKCMQSLLRVQARLRDHRARLSHDAGRHSMFAETTNFRDSSKYLRHRNSRSTEGSCVTDEWRPALECPRTLEELEAILKARNEAALVNEKFLAFAFAQQNNPVDSDRSAYNGDESELDNRTNWLDKWMATKQWETTSRSSTDYRRDSIKTVQIDSLKTTNTRRSLCQSPIHRNSTASPHHRLLAPSTPSLASRTRSPQIRPPSYSTANTPSLRSVYRVNTVAGAQKPNYMAATESAKARIRSQSAPRQRPSTPERERGGSAARKRLSYPVSEPYCVNFGFGCNKVGQNQRSPSFKSVQAGYVGMEEQSNYSYYTESIGGEISPCSTTDLRRWLR